MRYLYFSSYISSYLFAFLIIWYLPTCLPRHVYLPPFCLPDYLHSDYLPTCFPSYQYTCLQFKPEHDKTKKRTCAPSEEISVWAKRFISTWRLSHSKAMIRLVRCPGRSESLLGAQVILLVLSSSGPFMFPFFTIFLPACLCVQLTTMFVHLCFRSCLLAIEPIYLSACFSAYLPTSLPFLSTSFHTLNVSSCYL